jgi:hypothetical protein
MRAENRPEAVVDHKLQLEAAFANLLLPYGGLARHDEVARAVAGRGRSCRSDQEPSLTTRWVVGTQPVTNG